MKRQGDFDIVERIDIRGRLRAGRLRINRSGVWVMKKDKEKKISKKKIKDNVADTESVVEAGDGVTAEESESETGDKAVEEDEPAGQHEDDDEDSASEPDDEIDASDKTASDEETDSEEDKEDEDSDEDDDSDEDEDSDEADSYREDDDDEEDEFEWYTGRIKREVRQVKPRKKTALGAFLGGFLKAMVALFALIIVLLAVILVRELLIMKQQGESQTVVSEDMLSDYSESEYLVSGGTETDAIPETKEETAEREARYSVPVLVVNATGTKGLAAAWKEKLEAEGFTCVTVGNYLYGELETSTIYELAEDAAQDISEYLPDTEIKQGVATDVATDADTTGIEVIVVIGYDNDILSE